MKKNSNQTQKNDETNVLNSSNITNTSSTTTIIATTTSKKKRKEQAKKAQAQTNSIDEELKNEIENSKENNMINSKNNENKIEAMLNQNLEEVDLNNQMNELIEECRQESNSSSSSSASSSPPNNLTPISTVLAAQEQYHHPIQIVQPTQPIQSVQTVQPYPTVQRQRNNSINNNNQLNPMQPNIQQKPIQLSRTETNTKINTNNTKNSISNVNLNKQFEVEKQIKQELDLDSSNLISNNNIIINNKQKLSSSSSSPSPSSSSSSTSSNELNNLELDQDTTSLSLLDKQAMLIPQSLDNTAIQKLVCEEVKSHLILDDKESLQCKSAQEFISLFKSNVTSTIRQALNNDVPSFSSLESTSSLPPNDDKLVKCVSIFGNTGDGKSHTLNHTFFNGRNIFRTSHKQETCTMGVWCAYDSITNSLIFDTEGLLGTTSNENKRMRLLLKVLAISDVIVYRTRAERLHNDLFKFLSDASTAYLKYFSKELKQAAVKLKLDTISCLGPDCVIFHETQHTEILCDEIDSDGHERTVSHQLRDRFAKLDLSYSAYSSLAYVGTRTCYTGNLLDKQLVSTDFTKLAQTVRYLLRNNSVRPPRKLSSIYQVFKVLNDKFNGVITKNQISTFADEYFTCSSVCLSCGKRCQNSINHLKDGILHESSEKCQYSHQYDNKVYVCKYCHEAGKEVIVIPKTAASNDNSFIGIVKYTYSGYVLECPHHGIIFRSRQYWYGNPDPESVVRTELKHIWSGQQNNVGTSHNLSRKIIDNVSYIGDTIQSISAKPANIAKQWMADKVAPTYWVPNSDITECFTCHKSFEETKERKHHCRGCGKGFCDKCSLKRKVIPWWSQTDKVRVCNSCFDKNVIEEPKSLYQNYPGLNINSNNNNNSSNSKNGSTTSLSSLAIGANNDVMVRKVTETVQETIGLIGYATKFPLDVLKESARPSYWRPDSECIKCFICSKDFDEILLLHHCRSCGNGVCHSCSPNLRPVPSRGWETPVRVCNNCVSNEIAI